MVGQTKIQAIFDRYNLQTLPRAVLLIGEKGCGKHYFVNQLSKKFSLPVVDISKPTKISYMVDSEYQAAKTKWNDNLADLLVDAKICSIPKIYLLDMDSLTDQKEQNKFLKFIEDPGAMDYIILTSSSEVNLLNTIVNRCYKVIFEPYTKAELVELFPKIDKNDKVLDLCTTPGQLVAVDRIGINNLINFCDKIITNIDKASFANILSVSNKINFKEEYNKFDFNLFFRALKLEAYQIYIKTNNQLAYKIYMFTCTYTQRVYNNKEAFMLNFLAQLAAEVR